jgi:uncharacterized metal-binding protein YceD (DUF177 family)
MAKTPDLSLVPPAPKPDLPRLPFRVAQISGRTSTHVKFRPSTPERAAIAEALGLIELPALSFDGEIRPAGKRDLVLTGKLEAEIVQACVVSLAPVPGKIAESVTRKYLADWVEPEGDEVEIPEDDTTDPLPEVIDAAEVVIEALSLALPQYPRAPGAALGEAVFAEPGTTPLRDEDLRPFAGLAKLLPGGGQDGGGQDGEKA